MQWTNRRIWCLNWGIYIRNWHDWRIDMILGKSKSISRCLNRYEKWLIRYGYRCQCKYYNSDHFAWKLLQNSLKYPNYCFQNAKWSVWTKMRNGHSECLLRCDLIWNSTWTHLLHKYHFVQLEISENKKYPSDLLKWFGFFLNWQMASNFCSPTVCKWIQQCWININVTIL